MPNRIPAGKVCARNSWPLPACCRSGRRSPPTPSSASSTSGRGMTTATTRPMPKVPPLSRRCGIKAVGGREASRRPTDVQKTMESMINLDGAKILFPTSFGYFDPHILKVAKQYPKVQFLHCGGFTRKKDPTNVGSYFGYIDEASHLGHRGRAFDQIGQARLHRRQTHSSGSAQHQCLHPGRPQRQAGRDRAGDLHRRLVHAGERSRSGHQPYQSRG